MVPNASRPAAAQGGARGICARRVCVRGAAILALALGLGGAVAGTSAVAALPDGRVYEQASAVKKNGSEAGVTLTTESGAVNTLGAYGTAAPGGGAVAYTQEGPAGETESGQDLVSVSRRNPQTGWETSAALPPEAVPNGDFLGAKPLALLASADLSRFLFVAFGPFVKENSVSTGPAGGDENLGLYRTRGNVSEPEWLTRPTFEKFLQARPEPGNIEFGIEGVYPVGGSPDLSTVYFTYFGTLVPEDASRAPLVEPVEYPLWSSTEEYRERAVVVEANGEQFKSCEGKNTGHKPSETQGVKLEGEVTEQSATVKVASTDISPGAAVMGAKIKAGTTVATVVNENEVELSAAVEGAGSATVKEMLTFSSHCGAEGVRWEKTTPSQEQGVHSPWGFYEWHDGVLRSAGELPDHTYSRYGAVPATTETRTEASKFPFARFTLNEVSRDGSRAFFVSPEPRRIESSRCAGWCEAGTPVELYVREQTPAGPQTVLVSRDEHEAASPPPPAPAPACTKGASFAACGETAVTPFKAQNAPVAYVYASPDGSRAFFQSKDKLTSEAPEGAEPKTYEFDVNGEKLTYLPGVVGPIAASSQDGSSFIFKNTSSKEIELWTGGPAPVPIASFSAPAKPEEFEGVATNDGAVFVFDTNVLLNHVPAFNNSAGLLQAYRYEVSSKQLSCVSCAPEGVTQQPIDVGNAKRGAAREIADEGRRVFFGTAATLVPHEYEVEGVYEWEQAGTGSCRSEEREGGCVYLLSSATSPDRSFYLDNDESGENAFFATRAGLANGDTDNSYDVYDAREGGGFPEPQPPQECAGTCRSGGPAPTFPASLSAALGQPENTTRTTEEQGTLHAKSEEKSTRAKKLREALRACAKKPKRKRAACVKRARRLFGAKSTTKRHAGRGRG